MGLKTLIRMLGVLLVCLVIFGVVKCSSDGQGVTKVKSSDTRKKVFEDFPINEVAKVEIIEKDSTVTLTKGAETWVVDERADYPADTSKVIGLIRDIWDLDIAQPVPLQRNQFGRVQLLDPKAEDTAEGEASVIVKLSGEEGKDLGSIWLGKVHEASEGRPNPFGGGMMMNDVGRYVKPGDSNAVFIVEKTFNDAEAKPADWLDDEFFEVSKIKKISRKTKEPKEDWTLVREDLTGDFELVDVAADKELDSTKVTSMKSAFSSPQFDDILIGDEAVEPEASIFTVETFDGFTYTIAAGEKDDLNELPLTVKVSATFPEKREEGEEESPEEKQRKDEEFTKDIEARKEKLAKEKQLEGIVFNVRSFVVDSISKKRSEIVKDKPKPEPQEPETPEEPETETQPPAPQQPEPPKPAATKGKGKAKAESDSSPEAEKGEDGKGKSKAKAKSKSKGAKAKGKGEPDADADADADADE